MLTFCSSETSHSDENSSNDSVCVTSHKSFDEFEDNFEEQLMSETANVKTVNCFSTDSSCTCSNIFRICSDNEEARLYYKHEAI